MVPLKLNKGSKSIFRRYKVKRKIFAVILFLVLVSFTILNANAQWAKLYRGGAIENARSIQQTTDGGYIVAGSTRSFGAGGFDYWILKLDSIGEIEWEKTYGGSEADFASSIQQTNDDGYIVAGSARSFGAGESDSDIWILKLSSSGNIDWQKTYGLIEYDYDYASSIQQTTDGGYIVGGSTYFGVEGRGPNFCILKLGPNGEINWQRIYKVYDYHIHYTSKIQQTIEGGYVLVGVVESEITGQRDICILKLTSDGEIDWQKTYGGSSDDEYAGAIQQTTDGGYVIAGTTNSFGVGNYDIWILKISSTGEIDWQKTYGGSDGDEAGFIQQTTDGGYIVVATTFSFGFGASDIWILKLNSYGNIDWERTYGGWQHEGYSPQIQQTSDAGYIVATTTTSYNPAEDILILKLSPYGDIGPSCDLIGYPNALITNTSVSPVTVDITVQDIAFTVSDTDISGQDSQAVVDFLCGLPDTYTLTINAGTGGTTDPSPGTYTHDSGEEVVVVAIPDSDDYRFDSWTGDVPEGYENYNPITITMDSDKTIAANFVQQQYTLTISAGTGGTTNPSPGTYTHVSGTQVSIQATANSGYNFTGWSGDASGTTNPITITVDSDKSVKANFEAIPEPPEEPKKKKGCFIATAAYGSALHPHIDVLREFRDKYLVTNKPGRALVNFYYRYSPPIAKIITRNKILKTTVRVQLYPIVAFSYLMVH